MIFYMANIFELLNKLNVSLQGPPITLVDCKRKLSAFVDMAMVWKEDLAENLPKHLVGIMTSHL